MFQRLLRVFYVVEFLIALIAVFTVWSQVGGQNHLDYMAWYWKAGIGFAAAFATVRLTSAMVSDAPAARKHRIAWTLLLVLLALGAGGLTYYYHLNEPQEGDEEDQQAITPTAAVIVPFRSLLKKWTNDIARPGSAVPDVQAC